MSAQKRQPKHDPNHDVYVLETEEDGHPDEDPTIIETQVCMDWIEYDAEEEGKHLDKDRTCRLTFHVDLPERIAQHLFAHHVKDGRLTVEFHPPDPAHRRKGDLLDS